MTERDRSSHAEFLKDKYGLPGTMAPPENVTEVLEDLQDRGPWDLDDEALRNAVAALEG